MNQSAVADKSIQECTLVALNSIIKVEIEQMAQMYSTMEGNTLTKGIIEEFLETRKRKS